MSEMRLYDDTGNRLYLNAEERAAFLAAARQRPARDRTICETLHFTGCRPSELIEITPARIDLSGGTVTLRTLKKRKDSSGQPKTVYRVVPVPPDYLDTLNTAHGIREAQRSPRRANKPIWDLTRVSIWRIVKGVMIDAGIPDAPHRTAKGLRHGYGINATANGIQLHMLQKWMGHADMKSTAIYATAIGQEEQEIAARMWG
jgi:integrase